MAITESTLKTLTNNFLSLESLILDVKQKITEIPAKLDAQVAVIQSLNQQRESMAADLALQDIPDYTKFHALRQEIQDAEDKHLVIKSSEKGLNDKHKALKKDLLETEKRLNAAVIEYWGDKLDNAMKAALEAVKPHLLEAIQADMNLDVNGGFLKPPFLGNYVFSKRSGADEWWDKVQIPKVGDFHARQSKLISTVERGLGVMQ